MPKQDTIDKIVGYFHAVTTVPFIYKQQRYDPKPLRVSPGIGRGYTCPAKCGGCCYSSFTLDWIPGEERPDTTMIHSRYIEFDVPRGSKFEKRKVLVMTNDQGSHDKHHCIELSTKTGRCGIHGMHPFSCDFELLRFSFFTSPFAPTQLTTRLYGRGWNMLRVDGERGAKCEILPMTEKTREDTIRKLMRLQIWAKHFGLGRTRVPKILDWLDSEHNELQPLILE